MSAALSWIPPYAHRVDAVGRTHPGRRRATNEDAFAVHARLGLLVVADGMGGHAAGEVASQLAVDSMLEAFQDPLDPWSPHAALPPRAAGTALVAAFQRANTRVYTTGQEVPEMEGMGTTLVAALAFRGCLAIAHAGDSRAYLLRERWLARLTEDHTVANARRHDMHRFAGYGHALTRSVGASDAIEVELRFLTPRAGDVLLLCSDGLTNAVDDQEIAAILASNPDLEVAAERLIARANDHGGPDNITVALQRWSDRA
jgi:serine/threonine protein phosphatase PrpC